MNTLTTYFYNGANDTDGAMTEICLNGHCYFVAYIDVAIYYGQYIGADQVPSVQPQHLPGIQNVAFNAQLWKCDDVTAKPISKLATPSLIYQQDILDLDDQRICLGTRYTFCSKIIEDCGPNERFLLEWSTNRIEMAYGGDMIFISSQSGESNLLNPCD